MAHPYKGKFIVIDSLDGIGKTEVQKGILDYLNVNSERILDVDAFTFKHHDFPDFQNSHVNGRPNDFFQDLTNYDVLLTSEPTHIGIGQTIRNEIIQTNGRVYSALFTAEMFSADRFVLYKRIIFPALEAGKTIIQQRSVSTSIIYQPIQAQEQNSNLNLDVILSLPGNAQALEYAPDLLIIPTIKDTKEIMKRLKNRVKDDNADFERLEFQFKLKPFYESENLKNIFEQHGTKVEYLDASTTIDATRKQAQEIYRNTFDLNKP